MKALLYKSLFVVLPTLCLLGCGGSSSTAPLKPAVSISVSPSHTSLAVGETLFFLGTVQGSTNFGITWQVNGTTGGSLTLGTITPSGLYTAPASVPSPAAVTITAIAQADTAKKATATLTITIGVAVSPPDISMNISDAQCTQTQQFSTLVTGTSNSAVNWGVNGRASGAADATFGTITDSGLYTAPSAIPDPLQFDVTAQSQADSTQTARARITISAGGLGINRGYQSPPILLGTSGGNVNDQTSSFCCSGTLGALVTRGGKNFVLSNTHVLGRSGKAIAGEIISQPGLIDNSCNSGSTVAHFSQAVNLNSGGTSIADAALAEVVDGQVDPNGSVLQLGTVSCGIAQNAPPASTVAVAAIGMPVAKSGRTTGLTCSTIATTNATVRVQYENSCGSNATFSVTFNNQLVMDSTTFSAPGDSGSLVVNAQTAEPVALLFAGDDTSTIANPIQAVLASLADPEDSTTVPTFVGGATHPVEACTGPVNSSSTVKKNIFVPPEAHIMARAIQVKESHENALMVDPAILGVGVARDDATHEATIVIFTEQGKPHLAIPDSLDGVKTQIKTVKKFRAFSSSCLRNDL